MIVAVQFDDGRNQETIVGVLHHALRIHSRCSYRDGCSHGGCMKPSLTVFYCVRCADCLGSCHDGSHGGRTALSLTVFRCALRIGRFCSFLDGYHGDRTESSHPSVTDPKIAAQDSDARPGAPPFVLEP